LIVPPNPPENAVLPVLFLLFVAVPLIELALLLKIGSWLGAGQTFALVIITGIVGAALAKWQGLRTAMRVRSEIARGVLPATAMIDGLLIFVAGVLLITPGVLTDAFGLALLIPPARAGIRRAAANWFKKNVHVETSAAWDANSVSAGDGRPHDEIIDVRVVETRTVPDDAPD